MYQTVSILHPFSSQVNGSVCLNSTVRGEDSRPAITQNRTTPLSYPGREVYLQWDHVNRTVGPNNSYVTSAAAKARPSTACGFRSSTLPTSRSPTFPVTLAWRYSQVSCSSDPYHIEAVIADNVMDMSTFAGDPAANGTVFIAITDTWANNDPFWLLLTLTSFSGICQSPHLTFDGQLTCLCWTCAVPRLAKDHVAECELYGICWQNGLRRWFPYEGSAEVRKRSIYHCRVSNAKVKPMIVRRGIHSLIVFVNLQML
jgi:hypothetical protein